MNGLKMSKHNADFSHRFIYILGPHQYCLQQFHAHLLCKIICLYLRGWSVRNHLLKNLPAFADFTLSHKSLHCIFRYMKVLFQIFFGCLGFESIVFFQTNLASQKLKLLNFHRHHINFFYC